MFVCVRIFVQGAARHRIEQLMSQMTYRTGVTVHIEWQ